MNPYSNPNIIKSYKFSLGFRAPFLHSLLTACIWEPPARGEPIAAMRSRTASKPGADRAEQMRQRQDRVKRA